MDEDIFNENNMANGPNSEPNSIRLKYPRNTSDFINALFSSEADVRVCGVRV